MSNKGFTVSEFKEGIDTYKKGTAESTGYNKVKRAKPAGQSGTKLDGDTLVAFANNGRIGSIRLVNRQEHIKAALDKLKRDLKEMSTQIEIRKDIRYDKEGLLNLYKKMLSETLDSDYVEIIKTKEGFKTIKIFNVYESLGAIFDSDNYTLMSINNRKGV